MEGLSGLILTQADALHLAAAPLALDDFRPARLIDGAPPSARSPAVRELRQALAARGGPPEMWVRRGEGFALGPGVWARVLSPPFSSKGPSSAASRALILRVEAAGWRVLLLPAGADDASLADLAPNDLRCDVLIATALPANGWLRTFALDWVLLQDGGGSLGTSLPPGTLSQTRGGALTLRLYPDRLEASLFLNGSASVLRRPIP